MLKGGPKSGQYSPCIDSEVADENESRRKVVKLTNIRYELCHRLRKASANLNKIGLEALGNCTEYRSKAWTEYFTQTIVNIFVKDLTFCRHFASVWILSSDMTNI